MLLVVLVCPIDPVTKTQLTQNLFFLEEEGKRGKGRRRRVIAKLSFFSSKVLSVFSFRTNETLSSLSRVYVQGFPLFALLQTPAHLTAGIFCSRAGPLWHFFFNSLSHRASWALAILLAFGRHYQLKILHRISV